MMQRFGEKLRTLREKQGYSIRKLARELGFASHAHISRIEAGKKPTLDFVLLIAQFFEVSFDQLMNDELELD
ncbi:helix-turn-helix transcriptional regulator [Anaerolineales bacterium HSG6]|nr:helix-turn-helix transcriptional regulator [Anaerolineales bacterium HSG6]